MSKPKTINFELINPVTHPEPHRLLETVRKAYHPDLADARIALAWRLNWQADRDRLLTLGRCRKASDLDRELKDVDFVILLNHEAWDALTDPQRAALVDHELTHAAVSTDANGDPKIDSRGRKVWRIRKHDIEEFRDVIARHGLYKADLEAFFRAFLDRGAAPLFPDATGPAATLPYPAPAPAVEDDSWRGVSLGSLSLPAGIVEALARAGLHTVGDLADYSQASQLTDVPGIGEAKEEAIQRALERFWADRKAAGPQRTAARSLGQRLRTPEVQALGSEDGQRIAAMMSDGQHLLVKGLEVEVDEPLEDWVILVKGMSKTTAKQLLAAAALAGGGPAVREPAPAGEEAVA